MPVVLAERADEQSCTGDRLLSSLSGYLDKRQWGRCGRGTGRAQRSL